jgi:hypothetical protein
MGTSQSSKGSPSGVPMVPPWVPDLPLPPPLGSPPVPPPDGEAPGAAPPAADPASRPAQPPVAIPAPMAPAGRFRGANVNLGEWARTGDRGQLKRGLGHYVSKGYGGSATATRRMASTAQTANALYTALGGGGAANPLTAAGTTLDPTLTASMSADELMDAVVEAVRPVDGTQDAEANRASIMDALSEVLTEFPDADLMNLQPAQRELAIERFVAADIFHRIDLDIGAKICAKAATAAAGMGRLREMRDYVREHVAEAFRRVRAAGQTFVASRVTQIVQTAIRETFLVFEGYLE